MTIELSLSKLVKIEKLKDAFGTSLRENPDLLDLEAEDLIDHHWPILEDELMSGFTSAVNKVLVQVRNMVRLNISHSLPFTLPSTVKELVTDYSVKSGIWALTFEEYLRAGELKIKGQEMITRAVDSDAVAGIQHALWLLVDQSLIPGKFRGNKFLIFAGTVGMGAGGRRRVVCISWSGRGWRLSWEWLARDFAARGVLVCAKRIGQK